MSEYEEDWTEMAQDLARSQKANAQMKAALEEIREKAATMNNGGAYAAGLACLCLGTLKD